jgi:hypothetical protein
MAGRISWSDVAMKRTLLLGLRDGALLLLCAPLLAPGPTVDAMTMQPRDLVQTLVVNGRVRLPASYRSACS